MSRHRVYPAHAEARAHVLAPLDCLLDRDVVEQAAAAAGNNALKAAYEKGVQEGFRQSEAKLSGAAIALTESVRRLAVHQKAACEGLKHDVLRLSMAVARQVVMHELRTQPETIERVIVALLEEAEGRKIVSLRLSPADAKRIAASPVAATLAQVGVTVESSEEIRPGGCVLETGFGRLDARVETRLEEIASALMGGGTNHSQEVAE